LIGPPGCKNLRRHSCRKRKTNTTREKQKKTMFHPGSPVVRKDRCYEHISPFAPRCLIKPAKVYSLRVHELKTQPMPPDQPPRGATERFYRDSEHQLRNLHNHLRTCSTARKSGLRFEARVKGCFGSWDDMEEYLGDILHDVSVNTCVRAAGHDRLGNIKQEHGHMRTQ